MNTAGIREKLHHFIDTIEDKKAAAIYTLFENEMDTEAQRKKLILSERERYIKGEGTGFTKEEVRAMAMNKKKRNAL